MQNWDDLRYFLAVAQNGSITAASERLGVNQSTVSRRINAFEKELNVRLFERLTTGYVLTGEGEELQRRAGRIAEEALSIDRHIMGKNVALQGPIRITTSSILVNYLLMPILKEFNKRHPGIELRLDLSNGLYNISQREADVAIRVTKEGVPENLIARELGSMKFGVYGEKHYLQSYLKSSSTEPLNWIGEDNLDARPAWLPKKYQSLCLVMRTNEVLATAEAIKAGLGVGRLPRIVGDAEKQLTEFDVEHQVPQLPIWLLTHVDMRRVNRVNVFNSFVVDEVRSRLR